MNDKIALLEHTVTELLAGGGLAGAGVYGATRLLKEMARKKRDKEQLEKPEGLVVPVPGNKAAEESWNDNSFLKIPALMMGAPLGFMGADVLFKHFKQKQNEAAMAREQQKRLELMAQGKVASELETPNVDAFCEEFVKQADVSGIFDGAMTSIKGLLGDLSPNRLITGEQSPWSVARDAAVAKGSAASHDAFMNTTGLHMIPDAWKAMFALSALGTGGLLYNSKMNKDNAEQKKQYPSKVTLSPESTVGAQAG